MSVKLRGSRTSSKITKAMPKGQKSAGRGPDWTEMEKFMRQEHRNRRDQDTPDRFNAVSS